MPVVHKQVYTKSGLGGVVNTTLCGRVSNAANDMNVGEADTEISCKLCLKIMANKNHWMHKKVLTAEQVASM